MKVGSTTVLDPPPLREDPNDIRFFDKVFRHQSTAGSQYVEVEHLIRS